MSFDPKYRRFRCEICGKLIAKENIEFCNNCGFACHPDCKEKNQGICRNCQKEGVNENVQSQNIRTAR